MNEFVPLEITFRMQTPICLTYPWIHFDALMVHLKQREIDSHGYRSLPSKRVVASISEVDLPIKRTSEIYHASVSFFDTSEAYKTTIYKRFCERYLDMKRIKKKKIDRGRGHFRDFMINLVYIPTKKVTFYACGDPEKIEKLLAGLPGLGKKTAIGFGFIKDYKVREVREDYSVVRNNVAMRPIPVTLLKYTSETVAMAYKPPYWAKENVAICAPPGAHVKIKGDGDG